MLLSLLQDQFALILPLCLEEHLQLVFQSVVGGKSPGIVWVDDSSAPKSGLLWDKTYNLYLFGKADNLIFNQALSNLLETEILPEMKQRRLPIFKLFAGQAGWEKRLHELVPGQSGRKLERLFYRMGKLKTSAWRERLPEACSIKQIDPVLLENQDLKNLPLLRDEILSCWNTLPDFLRAGFGFCLLHEDQIACWCTGEYFSAGRCGIGIETVEGFQQRGYATLTASAFVEFSLAKGIAPHWDSWAWNEPSIRTAEKVGFEKVCQYWTYLFELPQEQ